MAAPLWLLLLLLLAAARPPPSHIDVRPASGALGGGLAEDAEADGADPGRLLDRLAVAEAVGAHVDGAGAGHAQRRAVRHAGQEGHDEVLPQVHGRRVGAHQHAAGAVRRLLQEEPRAGRRGPTGC